MSIIEADYTWTGDQFEQGVRLHIEKGGKISRISRKDQHLKDEGVHRLHGQALIPGMINAHSHAFQRGLRGKGEYYNKESKASFWSWREHMYSLVGSMTEDEFYRLSKEAFEEMRNNGITSVGEFHYLHHKEERKEGGEGKYDLDRVILRAAKDVGIRIVLLNTYYKRGGFGIPLSGPQNKFLTLTVEEYLKNLDSLSQILEPQTQSLGIVAHSIRAVDIEEIVSLHIESKKRGLVFHMHLEEQVREIEETMSALGKTPIRSILDRIDVDDRFTAVHCTHTEPKSLREFVSKGGNVCICPLTEGNLGDGIPDVMSCGGNICLGTDCNARICFAEEMRWLEYLQRVYHQRRGICVEDRPTNHLAKELLRYATENGAKSLGLDAGVIREGYFADFFTLDLSSPTLSGWTPDTLLDTFLFGSSSESAIHSTCVGGNWYHRKISTIPPILSEKKARKPLDATDVVTLAVSLIDIESISGYEAPMADALEEFLKQRSWEVIKSPVEIDRFNVFAYRKNKNPRLIFNSHIDTVPPYFSSRVENECIYGRGACDTKSLLASLLFASDALVRDGIEDIGLLFVISEETDHLGMKAANSLGLHPDYLIVAEPTQSKLIKRQKGILKLKLFSKGLAAHSGYPHTGESAIDKLLDVLNDIRREKWPSSPDLGDTTLNIGLIQGGKADNVVPDTAEASLMFRVIDNVEGLFSRVKEIVNDRVHVQRTTSNDPVELNVLEGYETDIAAFNTDIPYFKFDGKAYLYGPGSIMDAHTSREHIRIKDLKESVITYQKMAKQLLGIPI